MNKTLLLLFLLLFTSCTNNISDSGGASETVATITVKKTTVEGSLNKEGSYTVKIFNNSFTGYNDTSLSKFGDTLITDQFGNFTRTLPNTGIFNILIYDNYYKYATIQSLLITDSSYSLTTRLTETGTITGTLNYSNNKLIRDPYITLKGTDIYTESLNNGKFNLYNVPAGTYSIYYSVVDTLDDVNDSGNVLIDNSETITNISVGSGTTESIDIIIN